MLKKHFDLNEILDAMAEYFAMQLPDDVSGTITVEWDDDDGGINIYVNEDEKSSSIKQKPDKMLN